MNFLPHKAKKYTEEHAEIMEQIALILLRHENKSTLPGLSTNEIINELNKKLNRDTFTQCQQFFSLMSESSCEIPFIKNCLSVGTSSNLGQKYAIDWKFACNYLLEKHCLNLVSKVYGTAALRLISLLKDRGPMTQQEAEKICLILPNEFREAVFNLLKASFISTMVILLQRDFKLKF